MGTVYQTRDPDRATLEAKYEQKILMTHKVSFAKIGLLLAVTSLVFFTTALPHFALAAHEPTHIVTEPDALSTDTISTSAESGGISKIFANLGGGLKAVGRTILGWFRSIGRALGLGSDGRPEGASCLEVADCGRGLVCVNTCFEGEDCVVLDKLCTTITEDMSASIAVQPLYAECDTRNLCEKNTACTRTCPPGIDCAVKNRCLAPATPEGSCQEASDCASVCADEPFPPIGPSAFKPVCQENACLCETQEVQPTLHIVACDSVALQETLICPSGMRPACTDEGCVSGNCPVRLTCLTAPSYGGQCVMDAGCENVKCAEGTNPFCDLSDNKCRCKSIEAVTVSCTTLTECEGISCPADQARACTSGICTCEKKVLIEEDFICTSNEQCPASCPESFSAACVEGACACQRVIENVPVSCTTLSECEGVSCPAEFEKVCLDGTCACTRTTTE